jgi:hypothetical protein
MAISFAPTNLSSDQFVQQSMGRTLLNDCLADAMIYVGEARSMLQRQMWAAVLAALCHGSSARDSAALKATVEAERTPIFIITASLGSKILYDTLWKISKQRTSVTSRNDIRARCSVVHARQPNSSFVICCTHR